MADDTRRRIFLAVGLDDEVRHGLAAHLAAALGGGSLPGRAPPPENWHLTLRFLGRVEPIRYEVLIAGLDQADLGASFTLSFGRLGAFPRPGRATVLWLGIDEGSSPLTGVAAIIEEVVGTAGFMPEERPFHPHLTLSRIRPPQDVARLIERVPPFPLRQRVQRVTLFQSHLGGGPARYEALEVFPLR